MKRAMRYKLAKQKLAQITSVDEAMRHIQEENLFPVRVVRVPSGAQYAMGSEDGEIEFYTEQELIDAANELFE